MRSSPKLLDPREQHFRIPSHIAELSLFLRYLPPDAAPADPARAVLYVHGATFPSALSIAHRFDGRSWRDALVAGGFHVWGLDFLGFGASDPYPEMAEPAERNPPLGRAESASRQIERAVRFICAHHGIARISIIAHSWGTIATGRFAARYPDLVDRLVFFGPISARNSTMPPPDLPAWRLVSLQDQWSRFVEDVPPEAPPVLSRRHFAEWGEAYLDTDKQSRTRTPPSVMVPSGPSQDIAAAWAGDLAYEPGQIEAPVAIIRGEWDSLASDADARWLFDALKRSPSKRDVKLARATHLAHLEAAREELYAEAGCFLTETRRGSAQGGE